jgi:Coenzyme PQQ synthesis protein D (PqqD)
VNEQRWRRSAEVLWRRSLDAVVLLAPGRSEPFTLTGTGPEVWDLLDEAHSLDELAAVLASEHDAEDSVVVADLAPIIRELVAARAVDQNGE